MDGTERDRPSWKAAPCVIENLGGPDIAALIWDRIEAKRR